MIMFLRPLIISCRAGTDVFDLVRGKVAHHSGGHAEGQNPFWYVLVLSNQRARADDCARANLRMRQYDRVHTYQHMVGYRGTVNDRSVSNRTFVANRQGSIFIDMQYAVILNIGSPTDDNRSNISTYNRIVPDAGALSNGDVTDNHRAWGDEDILFNSGNHAFIG